MSRTVVFNEEYIMNQLVDYIKENGVENFTVRDIAKYIGCSTQPLFRLYKNTDELKSTLKKYLLKDYNEYIEKIIKKDDYLYTISYAYALYAKENPNIFRTLFITELAGTRTIQEVINSEWNRETIENIKEKYNISLEQAEETYRDVRFYTHGIACQLCTKSISIKEEELKALIKNIINKIIK